MQKEQDEEETHRESEKKKIRRKAALRKRTLGQFKLRMKELRHKEDLKRQDEFLEQAYRESLIVDEEEEASWDPIEDIMEADRSTYADLINLFLMIHDKVAEEVVSERKSSGEPNDSIGDPSASARKSAKKIQTSEAPTQRPKVK